MQAGTSKHGKKQNWTNDDTQLAILVFPTVLWYALFCYLPMFGVIIAFKEYQITGGFLNSILNSGFVGFKNFQVLFSNHDIWLIIRNTLAYNMVFIVLGILLPVSLAIIIFEMRNKLAAKIYQTILFIPYFLSWVVVSALVWAFLSYDMGLINMIFENLGLEPRLWYMEKFFWPPFLVFMNFWKTIGYSMIIYLATLTAMDKTFFEAAVLDGASKWQQIWHLTLPMMKSVIVLMFILSMGRIFYSDFGLFYQVPRDSNSIYTQVYTIDVFVYKQLKTSTTGMAAAAALLQSSVSCVTILFTNWLVKQIDTSSAMI
jgi:putative aldouronate transport system permease protein